MPSNLPIGIFDSGIGGLTVLRHIREQMPTESLIYVADRGHLPYGSKTNEFIQSRAIAISEFLLSQPVKAIVIACNTATAASVHTLRERYDLPIIGMEPGVKPAIQQSRNGIIGILATEGTLGSGKFRILLERHANGSDVFIKPCHGWVEHIETGNRSGTITRGIIEETVAPLLAKGIDTLVLGCTHYPFLMENIREVAGDEILIIDTGLAVATHLQHRLAENDLLCDPSSTPEVSFWCSGPHEEMRELLTRFWDSKPKLMTLPDQTNRS
ncbi:MAG: glutamate racemase [Chromatiales bacterium]|jgi:glutamate racemase